MYSYTLPKICMKRLISIPFFIIYLLAYIGPTVKMHYCSGELVEWKLITNTSNKVGCCDLPIDESCGILAIDNDCCEDVIVQIQVDIDAYQVAIQQFDILQNSLLPASNFYYQFSEQPLIQDQVTLHGLAPPFEGLWQQRALYDLYSKRKLDC